MDNLKKEDRTKNMKAIKSKNTKPEILIRKMLHSHGFRYSLHKKSLPGKPDIYLRKYNTAIFVHGCFWHQHENCSKAVMPRSNKEYWEKKLVRNIARDKLVVEELHGSGINVIIVWECEVKDILKYPNRLINLLK